MTVHGTESAFINILFNDGQAIQCQIRLWLHQGRRSLADNPRSHRMKDVPLPDAIGMLLKDTAISYTVDPAVAQLRVTAVLRSVTLDQAFEQILKAAGAIYRVENGVYRIDAANSPVTAGEAAVPVGLPIYAGAPGEQIAPARTPRL